MFETTKQQGKSAPKFQPEHEEPAYTEGGKFGRQEGQPGSKGPDVSPANVSVGAVPSGAEQVIQHPHNKQQAQGGVPEHHPRGG